MAQFVMIDFRLIKTRGFLKFIGPPYNIYLFLWCYVWRKEHYNLRMKLLDNDGYIVARISQKAIESACELADFSASQYISQLKRLGYIQVYSTGKVNIYILGKHVEVNGKRMEWYFIDRGYESYEEFLKRISEMPLDGQ